MSRMELVKEYIKDYIIINNVTGENIQRLYDEAWEICQESVSCEKSMFIMYMTD